MSKPYLRHPNFLTFLAGIKIHFSVNFLDFRALCMTVSETPMFIAMERILCPLYKHA
jgi:hypothetical protein